MPMTISEFQLGVAVDWQWRVFTALHNRSRDMLIELAHDLGREWDASRQKIPIGARARAPTANQRG
jgi:hypothetical protein